MAKKKPLHYQFQSIETVSMISKSDEQQLLDRFQFNTLRPHQLAAISTMAAGYDLLLLVGTSGGKTEAILGASILHPKRGIHVQIEPLRALQNDMCERLQKLGMRIVVLNSDLPSKLYLKAIADIKNRQVDCVLTTPEQLEKKAVFQALNCAGVATFAIDEAHCLLEYGGDFRPSYDRIGTFIRHLDHRPVVAACTATLAPDGIDKVVKSLGLNLPVCYQGTVDRPEIRQHVIEIGDALHRNERDLIEKERCRRLKKVLKEHAVDGDGAIVYCNTVSQTRQVTQLLVKAGYQAEAFYAELPAKQKEDIRGRFRSKNAPIIVATSAFGMGMDKPNIRLIVHMSLPLSVEDYWQKTGRAGRDGRKSYSYLFWHRSDLATNRLILSGSYTKLRKLKQLHDFVQAQTCYAQQLRVYFGQRARKKCGHCSCCNM